MKETNFDHLGSTPQARQQVLKRAIGRSKEWAKKKKKRANGGKAEAEAEASLDEALGVITSPLSHSS